MNGVRSLRDAVVSSEPAAGLMESFCKQEECPTSEDLAAVNDRDARLFVSELEEHVAECDFCSAEVDLYRHHPPINEEVPAGEMPRPLRELAEALMRKKADLSPLYRLIDQKD